MYDGSINWGLFGGMKEKFIAVRIHFNDNFLYAWIRLKVSDWELILFDYACTVGYN